MFRFFIKGVVQGVGFRPYIYNACVKEHLTGYVQNIGEGVVILIDNKAILESIISNLPPLCKIDSYTITETDEVCSGFEIRKSMGRGFSEIPADLFLCKDCLKELNDKNDRRFGYFFITCTNCGPRFSISQKSPYDRDTTTMGDFEMCLKCKAEYENPTNRRYHAQTIACNECGPKLSATIEKTVALLNSGNVVAIKGIGGFHLVCKINSVSKLRELTKRQNKPYAIMCKDVEMVETIAEINNIEKELLLSKERPIVILNKTENSKLNFVSELDSIGIMLPYTGLHYLLFEHFDEPLVMTSSNMVDNPMTTDSKDQFVKDVLSHDRVIENPVDDSLLKVISNHSFFIRRSRGFVPNSISLKGTGTIIALGAEMSSTFCIYKEGKAYPSQYLGTTSNVSAFNNYKKMVYKFMRFLDVKPDTVLVDLHPEYNTSKFGVELAKELGANLVKVQHHKSHAYSVAAEHSLDNFVGIVCDGLGFGEDNTIWGGEIFDCGKRVGHLESQLQLGGDSATQNPEKMLFSILSKFLNIDEISKYTSFSKKELDILKKQLNNKINTPITTSCGRILDAASALLGFCKERTYEGRPAMLLDANSSKPFELKPVIKDNILMITPLFEFLIKNISKDKTCLAATVQKYIAEGLYEIAKQYQKPIVFSGGCAYSKIMSEFMIRKGVYVNKEVPAGDGGISFGQIAYYLRNSN